MKRKKSSPNCNGNRKIRQNIEIEILKEHTLKYVIKWFIFELHYSSTNVDNVLYLFQRHITIKKGPFLRGNVLTGWLGVKMC